MDLLPLLLIFAVMMLPLLFMSNRQRKQQRAHQEMVSKLGIGDEVRTHSGFYGLIVDEYDDAVVLESEDGSQSKWARQAVAMKVEEPAASAEDADPAAQGEEAEASSDSVPGVTVREDDSDSSGSSDSRESR